MQKNLLLTLFILLLGVANIQAINYTFTGAGDGTSAQDPLNWDIGVDEGEPFTNYEAVIVNLIIPEGFTVINNGTINWSTSHMYGPGTFINYGTFNIISTTNNSINDMTFINHGLILLDSEETDGTIHGVGFGIGATLNNESDGSIIMVDLSLSAGGTYNHFGTLNNNGGSITKAGSYDLHISVLFRNYNGNIDVEGGELLISATSYFEDHNTFVDGVYNVNTDGNLLLTGFRNDYSGNLQGSIDGFLEMRNYIYFLDEVDFNFANQGVYFQSATIAGGSTLTNNTVINFVPGIWITDAIIINHSVMNFIQEDALYATNVSLSGDSKIQNESDGILNFDFMGVSGAPTNLLENNGGTINVTKEDLLIQGCPFTINEGILNITGEGLRMQSSATNSLISCTINVADSSTLELRDSTIFSGNIEGINDGKIELEGNFFVYEEASLNITNNPLYFYYGTIQGGGVLTSNETFNFTNSGGGPYKHIQYETTFINQGEMNFINDGTTFNIDVAINYGGKLQNDPEGTINFDYMGITSSTDGIFENNGGIINRSGDPSLISINANFINTGGTINVLTQEFRFDALSTNQFNDATINVAENTTFEIRDTTIFSGFVNGENNGEFNMRGVILVDDQAIFNTVGDSIDINANFIGDGTLINNSTMFFDAYGATKYINDDFQIHNNGTFTIGNTGQYLYL